ncbi:hypothetical protein FVE85_1716 [Porphyridium purpureum]|uniref:Uncharacterized protein n=1 Tax=Porphyridium purpureum TaxID=35688 RepID=A0A5J4YVN5_PORPP|nr:hypothetical protein FVE85_1716 [Porphyridium purpureum]|eukprot:POR5556..scf209_3
MISFALPFSDGVFIDAVNVFGRLAEQAPVDFTSTYRRSTQRADFALWLPCRFSRRLMVLDPHWRDVLFADSVKGRNGSRSIDLQQFQERIRSATFMYPMDANTGRAVRLPEGFSSVAMWGSNGDINGSLQRLAKRARDADGQVEPVDTLLRDVQAWFQARQIGTQFLERAFEVLGSDLTTNTLSRDSVEITILQLARAVDPDPSDAVLDWTTWVHALTQ